MLQYPWQTSPSPRKTTEKTWHNEGSMGYGINTQMIHGLYLDPQQSKQLHDGITAWLQTGAGDALGGGINAESDLFDVLEMLGDEDEEAGIRVTMVSEDTHSTIHSTTYEAGRFHGFGILLADKGYGSYRPDADFAKASKEGATDAQKTAYTVRLGGILKLAGLDMLEPQMVIISHTS